MERMLRTTFAALAALALFTGCRHVEQELPEASSVKSVRFRAGTAETRTAFAEAVNGVYQTLWTRNDREVLLSLNYAAAEPSEVSASADGRTATFEASFDAAAAKAPYTFYAVSPASAARAISPSRKAWSVYIAADQVPSALSVDEGAQLLVAKSAASATLPDVVDLHFSHLTAYGRITLKNLAPGEAQVRKAELIFETPVVGEWYWGEDGTLTSNGASHTITLSTDASGDLWFACAPVSVGNTGMTLDLYTDKGVLRKEITFPEGRSFASGKVARFSIDMAGIEPVLAASFVRVTDASTLREGDKVLIVNKDATYAMGDQVTSGTAHRKREAVQVENGIIVDPGKATVLTLETGSVSGTWSFRTESGYLASASTGNVLKETDEKNGYSSWTVSVSDGTATVMSQTGRSRFLRYNAQAPRFSCYASERSQQDIAIYRLDSASSGISPENDPLAGSAEYGCYLTGSRRTYVKGSDQIHRSYGADGKLVFALLNAGAKEQLVISGYDPSLAKGDEVTVTVRWRKGTQILLKEQSRRMTVIREDGPKVWLGNGTGEGFIIKK